MSSTPAIERRYLQAAEHVALRENVKFDADAITSMKSIIRAGALKLDVMGFAEDESRIDAAESNLAAFVRGLAKTAKDGSQFKITSKMVDKGISRGSVWPFS